MTVESSTMLVFDIIWAFHNADRLKGHLGALGRSNAETVESVSVVSEMVYFKGLAIAIEIGDPE